MSGCAAPAPLQNVTRFNIQPGVAPDSLIDLASMETVPAELMMTPETPAADAAYDRVGYASWYGSESGDQTANGERFRPVEIRSVHADGDAVIVVWDGRGVANDGQAYENSYAWFMRMSDGKVIDGTAFFDSISFNDLWSRVQP